MRKLFLTDTLIILIACSYSTLFWKEKMGLNVLLFGLVITVSVLLQHGVKENPYLKLTAFTTLLTAVMVVFNNSLISKIVHICSLMAMLGFAQNRTLRFIWYALLLTLFNMLETPKKFLHQFNENFGTAFKPQQMLRNFQFSVLPIGLLGLFYVIYYVANPKFAEISNAFWTNCWWFLRTYIPLPRLLLFGLGGLIAGAALWKTSKTYFFQQANYQNEELQRYYPQQRAKKFPIMALKQEFGQGVLLLGLLNVLLSVVNGIDIRFVWLAKTTGTAQEMRQYVHSGTYLLIVAILLAMTVILYYFRGNLNFYLKNTKLRWLAYGWLVQNAILALSVAMRNIAYIEQYNLAYKRIGVFIFLTLAIVGLFTLFLKIKNQKTMYYLLQRNALAAYLVWNLMSLVNWDIWITQYNLRKGHTAGLDAYFLVYEVSDKNLYLLLEHQELLKSKNYNLRFDNRLVEQKIEKKKRNFVEKQTHYSWLSWNYPDYKNLLMIRRIRKS